MESDKNLVPLNSGITLSGCLARNTAGLSCLPEGIYWGDLKTFHPALDFKNGTAFVAVNLDFKAIVQKEGKTIEDIIPKVYVVDSKGNLYSITDERAFAAKGLRLAKNIVMVPYRWNKGRLKEFLEGQTTLNVGRLFDSVKGCFRRYIHFEEQDTYSFMALWTIGTYLHPLFDAFPMVLLCGPKDSGKSLTLQVTSLLAFNARLQGDPTPATMFRTIDEERPTMLFDEMEWLSHKDVNNQMATILKFGYKPGCKVPRCTFDKFHNPYPTEFDAYCPKMFANINGLENVLGDRTITFYQKRKTNSDTGIEDRSPSKDSGIWQEIRHTLYLFTLTKWEGVKRILDEQRDIPLQNRD
ncbi:MAG: hypothetical protein NTZ48_03100, partial [Candidatus Omnitrophica bacterium]|nr:hypothetical protein [Candidatus Omnitrophota bacterium]